MPAEAAAAACTRIGSRSASHRPPPRPAQAKFASDWIVAIALDNAQQWVDVLKEAGKARPLFRRSTLVRWLPLGGVKGVLLTQACS